jgi:flagellar biosynthetic protein FlhB
VAEDKTEKPTAKRKREARQKGQVVKSTEVNGVVVLIAGFAALLLVGPRIVDGSAAAMRSTFALIAHPDEVSSSVGLHALMSLGLHTMESALGPVAGICLGAALLSNVAQVGMRPTLRAVRPDFKKINPLTGFKSVFGPRIGVELFKVLAKIAVVGGVVAMALVPQITHLTASVGTTPFALGSLMNSTAGSIVEQVAAAYLLIAAIDYGFQRRRHNKGMKMTKQEVKDEAKNADLPAEIKGAIRRRQMQAARARMMAAVPSADVVVTNPTHYAVALRYDGSHPAPLVVAKGKNLVAAQIRRIATEHGVPIVPDPPLARALHAAVQIDRMIPAELYAAVAQVLAYVYKMAGRRRLAA